MFNLSTTVLALSLYSLLNVLTFILDVILLNRFRQFSIITLILCKLLAIAIKLLHGSILSLQPIKFCFCVPSKKSQSHLVTFDQLAISPLFLFRTYCYGFVLGFLNVSIFMGALPSSVSSYYYDKIFFIQCNFLNM